MGQLTDHPVALRPEYKNDVTAQATKRLLDRCNEHQGGSTYPINAFLLSLYNGRCWAPDMQLLCNRIDKEAFEDVVAVMRGYSTRGTELHGYFVNGDKLFEGIGLRVRLRETGGFCDDHHMLSLEEYLDAVIDNIALFIAKPKAVKMVSLARAGGFFSRHASCDDLRRRGSVRTDATAIQEQAEEEDWLL